MWVPLLVALDYFTSAAICPVSAFVTRSQYHNQRRHYARQKIQEQAGTSSFSSFSSSSSCSSLNARTASSSSSSTNNSIIPKQEEQKQQQLQPLSPSIIKRQIRRPPTKPRKPRNYWNSIPNMDAELRSFWSDDLLLPSFPSPSQHPPPIPSETLLNHFHRHDIRHGIVACGGRHQLSILLGLFYRKNGPPAVIIPGKWCDAVRDHPEIFDALLDPMNPRGEGLKRDEPPSSSSSLALMRRDEVKIEKKKKKKPRGYWKDEGVVVKELYQFLEAYKISHGRPSIWMPRLNEILHQNRSDLKSAIFRHGGSDYICQLAHLVPFSEWQFFESQLHLFVSLQSYLSRYCYHDDHDDDDEVFFPRPTDLLMNGENGLHDAIQNHGGSKFLASKLGMSLVSQGYGSDTALPSSSSSSSMHLIYGPFSLDFAIRLLRYVREVEMAKTPFKKTKTSSSSYRSISMPSKEVFMQTKEGRLLLAEIEKFGGHENVSRRLGLGFFF